MVNNLLYTLNVLMFVNSRIYLVRYKRLTSNITTKAAGLEATVDK